MRQSILQWATLSSLAATLAAFVALPACRAQAPSTPARPARSALPAHCEVSEETAAWPVVGDRTVADATLTRKPLLTDGKSVTAAFRRDFFEQVTPRVKGSLAVIVKADSPCMKTDAGYYIRPVPRSAAYGAVQALITEHDGHFRESLLYGALVDLAGKGWVWSVFFGGASRQLPPHGAFEGLLDPVTGRLVVAIHHPEG